VVILTHALHIAEKRPGENGDAAANGDLERLARHGVNIAHCPVVMRRTGRALQSFSRYRRAGLNLGLGTDTFPPDMIEEMRWASIASKLTDRNPASGAAREIFEAATIGGATALGRSDLGRLAAGAKADVTIVDLRRLHIGPRDDPFRSLIHYATQGDVEHVFVDGRLRVESGRVVGLDEPGTVAAARVLTGKMAQRFADWTGRPVDQLLPSSFPIM
jgi:cytosine/adenosine deaminase-related metal-dependent hydrolase